MARSGADWQAGERVQVNDNLDDPNDLLDPNDPNGPAHHSDQFLPAATVDKHGNVHVVFYDDRRYRQLDDPNAAPPPRFDVFYAFSGDHGATFTNWRLGKFNDPNQPAVSYASGRARFGPGDYLSLAANAGQTWAAYGGHAPDDDPNRADAPCVYVAPTPIRLTPTIAPVELVDSSREPALWETDLAVTGSRVVAVCRFGGRARRGVRSVPDGSWDVRNIPDPVDPNQSPSAVDPCLAGDPTTGNMMAACIPGGPDARFSLFDASLQDPNFAPWTNVSDTDQPGQDPTVDKPWITRGESREYYITVFVGPIGELRYARTINDGQTWFYDDILVGGNTVSSGFAPHPTAVGRGPLFVSYASSNDRFRFLEGYDPTEPNSPMEFLQLRRASNPNASLQITAPQAGTEDFSLPRIQRVCYINADPVFRFDRFYGAYHAPAVATAGDDDVHVFANRITRAPNGNWTANEAVPLKPNASAGDQVKPALVCDLFGRVHAIFYDDEERSWDVRYAISFDYGETFDAYSIAGLDPKVPILDPRPGGSGSLVGEYVGIDSGVNGDVWVSIIGTLRSDSDPGDPAEDQTALFVTHITFEE